MVSVLPRGESFGDAALVALDIDSLDLLAMREFPTEEYLCDPSCADPGPIRHCRGIAQSGQTLLAALFNGVREYDVEAIRELRLRPRRLLSDPRAVDLHGIEARAGVLSAASTGSDAVLHWDLASGQASVVALGENGANGDGDGDLRFPDKLARERGYDDWRAVLDAALHVNGVSRDSDGSLIVSSLTCVVRVAAGAPRPIVEDPRARMHDGSPVTGGELLLTDAARGTLVSLDLETGARRFLAVADPADWFVRGLCVVDTTAYVLRSKVVASRQRDPRGRHQLRVAPTDGASFGISVVDLSCLALVEERAVDLPRLAPGTVAYGLLAWDDKL